MDNAVVLYRNDPYPPGEVDTNANIQQSRFAPEGTSSKDYHWKVLYKCEPDSSSTLGENTRKCTYNLDDSLTDMQQLIELLPAYRNHTVNKAELKRVIEKVCNESDDHGSEVEKHNSFGEFIDAASCPSYEDVETNEVVHMKRCPRWRRTDAVGKRCRDLINLINTGSETFQPERTYLELGRKFCENPKNLYVEDCLCINRRLDPDYNKFANDHMASYQTSDHCWFKPCKDGSRLLDDTLSGVSCNANICSVVLNVASKGEIKLNGNKIDITSCGGISGRNKPLPNEAGETLQNGNSKQEHTVLSFVKKNWIYGLVGVLGILLILNKSKLKYKSDTGRKQIVILNGNQ